MIVLIKENAKNKFKVVDKIKFKNGQTVINNNEIVNGKVTILNNNEIHKYIKRGY